MSITTQQIAQLAAMRGIISNADWDYQKTSDAAAAEIIAKYMPNEIISTSNQLNFISLQLTNLTTQQTTLAAHLAILQSS